MKVAPEISDALRNETELQSKELNVLRDTTLLIVRNRGIVNESELNTFYSAGFTKQHLLDIVLVLSQKVMSNYINHLVDTPLDEPFQKFEWTKQTSLNRQQNYIRNSFRILRVQDLVHPIYAKRCCLIWQLLPSKTWRFLRRAFVRIRR